MSEGKFRRKAWKMCISFGLADQSEPDPTNHHETAHNSFWSIEAYREFVSDIFGLRVAWQARKHFAQIYNNLIRRDLAGFVMYVERDPFILHALVMGYENPDIALNCGSMMREVRLMFLWEVWISQAQM